ncbi:hypothetical protein [Paenibacillus sp. S150]|uniref:hypothetical protein n=1 Tax=Paenibacillus sp. S150 TaxID=2749826 RepID=UPI001C56DE23|nr:hypothetical protein [Paenibacillus sp. S150]MBW4083512.1 hypothetical protein [Paenibacillus sp. S150]
MDELTMLRNYILLPYMQTMVEKSIADIEYSTNVMSQAYLMAGQHVLDQITKESFACPPVTMLELERFSY